MKKGIVAKKALAVTGTALVLLPVLFAVATSVYAAAADGEFLFDYLMPLELFPFVLFGGLLLLWAALWARALWPRVAAGLALAALCFFGCQWIAKAGLPASGRSAAGGFAWYAVLFAVALYAAAEIFLGAAGILLAKKLFAGKGKKSNAGG